MRSFCRKTHVHKIPRFRGAGLGGGGSADFIFMGAGIFLNYRGNAFIAMVTFFSSLAKECQAKGNAARKCSLL